MTIQTRVAKKSVPDITEAPNPVIIVGPTAVGKSALGIYLAQHLNGEVVSADSMQVYRFFDIGTGKVPLEKRGGIRHHLLSHVDPPERYSAAQFAEEADGRVRDSWRRGKRPIIVGGSGLYVRAWLYGLFSAPPASAVLRKEHRFLADRYGVAHLHEALTAVDPKVARAISDQDFIRISRALEVYHQTGRKISSLRDAHGFSERRYRVTIIGLRADPVALRKRIENRVDAMLEQGWLGEVRSLREKGYGATHPMNAIGYRELSAHLEGALGFSETVARIKSRTWRFSKRQRNWFDHEDDVRWFTDPIAMADILAYVDR